VLWGRLTTRDDAAIPQAPIELQVRGSRGQRTVATAVTAADGVFTATITPASAIRVRALDRGDAGRPAVVSPAIRVLARPQIELAASAPATLPGVPVQLFGRVTPRKRKLSLIASLQGPDGRFAPVHAVPVAVAADGRFSASLALTAPGHYQVAARTGTDKAHAAGASAPVTIIVA
jgi:hypothetical protein